jgi:hypothetical protein
LNPENTSTNKYFYKPNANMKKMRVKKKYKSSRASEETTASTVTVVVHLHDTILTVVTFWPIFRAVFV